MDKTSRLCFESRVTFTKAAGEAEAGPSVGKEQDGGSGDQEAATR